MLDFRMRSEFRLLQSDQDRLEHSEFEDFGRIGMIRILEGLRDDSGWIDEGLGSLGQRTEQFNTG